MRVLSLFAGVGMFDYAWKKLGWETVAFAEMDKFCQRVLEKHHPGVPIYDDVRDVTYERLKKDGLVPNTAGAGLGRPVREEHEGRRNGFTAKSEDVSNAQHNGRSAKQEFRCNETSGDSRGQEEQVSTRKPERKDRSGDVQGIQRSAAGSEQGQNQPTGIDLICGGFPCQDLSVAGNQKGIDGERSGLWSEFARIIGEFRPRYVIVENVSALLSGDSGRWFQRILGDLAEIGYDCEWHCICAGKSDGTIGAGAPGNQRGINDRGSDSNTGQDAGAGVVEQCGEGEQTQGTR